MLLIESAWGACAPGAGARARSTSTFFYDDEVIEEPDLQVPHPEAIIALRAFLPLLELDPNFRTPSPRRRCAG